MFSSRTFWIGLGIGALVGLYADKIPLVSTAAGFLPGRK